MRIDAFGGDILQNADCIIILERNIDAFRSMYTVTLIIHDASCIYTIYRKSHVMHHILCNMGQISCIISHIMSYHRISSVTVIMYIPQINSNHMSYVTLYIYYIYSYVIYCVPCIEIILNNIIICADAYILYHMLLFCSPGFHHWWNCLNIPDSVGFYEDVHWIWNLLLLLWLWNI